jgi:hypothetical protein
MATNPYSNATPVQWDTGHELNPYFDTINRKSEQELHEALVVENIQMHGINILYVPLENFKVDPVLQEPRNITYQNSYAIEAYLPDNGETDGQQNIMSKFGFRVNKSIEILIARKRFREVCPNKERPLEGDLIYIGDPQNPKGSFMNVFFEINQVSYQSPEWPFGNHYTYKLFCETYTYSYEKFDTGIPAIDQFDLTGPENAPDRLDIQKTASNDAIDGAKQQFQEFNKNNPLTGL